MPDPDVYYRVLDDGFLLRLARGVPVAAAIMRFIREHQIGSAAVSGIGAVSDAELGYYHLQTKTYRRKTFNGIYELLSFSGNIAWIDGREPFLHVHAVLADQDFSTVGGHFFEAVVAVTVEVHLRVFAETATRSFDEETGLNLLNL